MSIVNRICSTHLQHMVGPTHAVSKEFKRTNSIRRNSTMHSELEESGTHKSANTHAGKTQRPVAILSTFRGLNP